MQQIIIRMQQKGNKIVKFFYYPNTDFCFKFISRFILVFLLYLILISVFLYIKEVWYNENLVMKFVYAIPGANNFVPGSFFEEDHLLNLIILVVYAERWPKCSRISKQKLM